MKDWRHLFRDVILERGLDYYANDRIVEFKKKDNCYTAIVEGEYRYLVQVIMRGNKVFDVYCDCPYYVKGELCKHIVAVLLKIEEIEGYEV